MRIKTIKSIFFTSALFAITTLSGCKIIDMSTSDELYSFTLGSEAATFTITSAKVNGKETLSHDFVEDNLAYDKDDYTGYLTTYITKDKDETIEYTLTDYTAGSSSWNQWITFFATDDDQWIARADSANNATSDLMPYTVYGGTPTSSNITLWDNETIKINVKWNHSDKRITVVAANADKSKCYVASAGASTATYKAYSAYSTPASTVFDDTATLSWGLGSENATLTITSVILNGVEQLSSNVTQTGLSWGSGDLKYDFPASAPATVTYTITDYTAGSGAGDQWLAYFYADGTLKWGLRPDHYSPTADAGDPTYSGTLATGTYTDTTEWNGETFTITMSWDPDSRRLSVIAINQEYKRI